MMAYANTLPAAEKRRYLLKLEVLYNSKDPDIAIDPYQIDNGKWKDDITLWPPVEFGEIYTYLIDTPGPFTREKMKAYKSLEAFNYYISGWVQAILYYDLGSNCLLKAKVRASQRMSTDHEAWVGVVIATGTVISGHCTCMAGCGEVCSHVAAVLFKVEACIRLKIATRTCTDLPCVWNQASSKSVQPSEAVDIHFFKPNPKRSSKETLVDMHLAEKRQRCTLPELKPKLHPEHVFSKLHECFPKAAVFSVLPDYIQSRPISSRISTVAESSTTATVAESSTATTVAESSTTAATDPSLPQPLTDLYDPKNKVLSTPDLEQACTRALNRIKVTQDEANFLEKSTINQSKCLTWYEHRKGRITASHFYNVSRHIASNSTTYPNSIVASIMQYNSSIDHVPALRWGRENEDRARKAYTTKIQLEHQGVCVRSCGLVVSPKYPFFGASPDGILSCTCCSDTVLLEIKCPYKYRDQLPTSDIPLSDREFCLNRSPTGDVHLSDTHRYFYQVQGQLALCNVTYCDFVCWTNRGIFVERIEKDNLFISKMLSHLQLFLTKYLLPELLTCNLESEHPGSDKENEVFCVCQKPESGRMIACDNPKCSIAWFHYKCVGIKRAPRGKWYCSHCRNVK